MNLFRRILGLGKRPATNDSGSKSGRTPEGDALEHSIIEALKGEIMSQAYKVDHGFRIVFSFDIEITSCHLEKTDTPGQHIENDIDIEDYTERIGQIN